MMQANNHILITSSHPNNIFHKKLFLKKGWEVSLQSMHFARYCALPFGFIENLILEGKKFFIFTSVHGAMGFVENFLNLNFDMENFYFLFSGPESFGVILDYFPNSKKNILYVHEGMGENARGIFDFIKVNLAKGDRIFHFCGQILRFDIIEQLGVVGFFNLLKVPVYEMVPVQDFGTDILDKFSKQKITHLYFASIGAVNLFYKIAKEKGINTKGCIPIFISDAVRKAYEDLIL